jgi:NAD(P)-dependent dehydrogenase (short-subunit alcohol dehydrogenase family)
MSNTSLVIGASSGIARATIEELLASDSTMLVVAVSRSSAPSSLDSRCRWLQCSYEDREIGETLREITKLGGEISKVFIFNGILHSNEIHPEKRVEDIDRESLHAVFEANAVVPMLWVKNLKSLLRGPKPTVICVLSARVGSISDNKKGGWYAYRASKAALNMFLKTSAIEFARVAPKSQFIIFHPGTTDTPLSSPFQASVPADRLFSPSFVASKMIQIVEKHIRSETGVGEAHFLAWDGSTVSW